MRMQHLLRAPAWDAVRLTSLVAVGLWGSLALGQGLSYQKATDDPLGSSPNISPMSAYVDPMTMATAGSVDTDNLWGLRIDFGTQDALGSSVWQVGVNEDAPELTQTLTGLTPNTEYDLYAAYWTDDDENWSIRTGVMPGNTTLYSFVGDHRAFPLEGSTVGLAAGAAIWSSPPPPTNAGTPFVEARPASTERFMDPLVMLLGYSGRATSNGSGQLNVYVDDLPVSGAANRTWFDGVAYRPASDTPVALTATVDRSTGAVTVTNDTGQNFDVKSYLVNSNGTTLDVSEWSMIGGSWTVTDPDPMMPTPDFATNLSEDGGGASVTINSGGGTLNFGNVWAKSPIEDIRIYLTLGDDSLAVLAPNYLGTGLEFGDFDGNGMIDLVDYETLITNMHAPLTGTAGVETYLQGDFNRSGGVNYTDFLLFRDAYISANGAAAWAALGAAVPEPASATLLVLAAMGAVLSRRRRSARRASRALAALAVCGLFFGFCELSSAQQWDVNDDDAASPTQVDWIGLDATNINSVTFTAVGTAADGTTAVTIDDRDRTGYGGDFNDMWRDFIFANGSTGEGSGMDVLIGGLPANNAYTITLWMFDTSSAGARSAFWNGNVYTFDGNDPEPTTLDEYSLSLPVVSDNNGEILLEGRANVPGSIVSHTVFLNGFQLSDLNSLTLEVNTVNGNVSIVNTTSSDVDLSYYEILSPGGALNVGGWTTLDSTEGGDPVGTGWDPAGGSSSTILSEANLLTMSTIGMGGGEFNLGSAFMPGGTEDLAFRYAGPGAGLSVGVVQYVTDVSDLIGDYNGDDVVNAADYVVWRNNEGGDGSLLQNRDPANMGVIGAADYQSWVNNFGMTAGSGSSSAAVPEPAVASLLGVALLLVGVSRRSRRTAA